jgi:glutamate racemase
VIQAKMGRQCQIIDSSQEVALWVKEYLEENPELMRSLEPAVAQAGHRFFVSDLTPNFEQIAKEFLGRPISLELV